MIMKRHGIFLKNFFGKIERKGQLARKVNYEKFLKSYKTIFNRLRVKSNGKEEFWIRLKKNYDDNNLDCYEIIF
jgi:hypothetical protein